MATYNNKPASVGLSDPKLVRQTEAALAQASIIARGKATVTTAGELILPNTTLAVGANSVSTTTSANNSSADIVTVYSGQGAIYASSIDQTVNQTVVNQIGVNSIVAGNNITITSTGTSEGTGAVTITAVLDGNNAPGGSNTQIQFNDGGVFGGNAGFTFNKTTGVLAAPFFSGPGNSLSNIQGTNVTGAVAFAGTANSVALANVSGAGNIASINLTGSTSNVLYGNGVFAAVATSAGIANGTSNVTVPAVNGNVNLVSAGNTTMVVTGTGANITGTLSVSSNANIGNIGTGGLITATGNITGGNLVTGGALSVTGNANVGNLGTTTAVITTGNITTINSGLMKNGNSNIAITANSNIAINVGAASYTFSDLALNVTTNPPASPAPTLSGFGLVSAPEFTSGTGNITVNANSNLWLFSSTGNLTLPANTFSIYFANGSQAVSSSIANGNSNVSVATSNGNVTINAVGNATMTVTGTGANVTGTLSVSSNANIGNIGTGGLITATGNITGGNLTTSGNLVFSPTQVQSSAYAGGNGHAMMIDTNRTDTYVANGSADKPFKTFAAAIAAVAAENPSGTVPYTFILMGCNINETVDFTPYNFNFITISTTCRSVFNDPVIFGNSALKQLTIRNVEFGDTVAITGDGTTDQFNNTSLYNVSFTGALTVTAVNAVAFYEAAFFSTVTFNNVSYCYVNGGQFNDDWTIRVDDTGSYPVPSGGISPGVILALDFIANDINFVKGGTGVGVFQPHSSRMGRTGQTYTLPASWILTAYSSAFLGNWVNDGTWTMRNSVNVVAIANTAPTYSGIIGGTTITATGNITGGNLVTGGVLSVTGNANVGNLGTTTLIATTSNITTINSGLLQNGNSNITITANGNISLSATGTPDEVVITSTGVNVAGTLSVSGNANVGNLGTTGNITGNTNGFAIGYLNIPQVAASNATLALSDAGKHYYSTSTGNFTLTVPNNTSASFATGTAISIVVQSTGNVLVNAASGVTLYLAGNSTAANRVVSNYGMATLMKVATDTWMINGTGVA